LSVASLGIEGSLDFGVVDLGDLVQVEGVDLAGVAGAITHGSVGFLELVHLFLDLGLEVLELGAQVGQGTGEQDTRAAGFDDVGNAVGEGVDELLDELAVHGVDLQPMLDHGSLALLEGQGQPGDVVQGEAERAADVEIGLLSELTTVQSFADHNHHTVELNLDPQLDAVQQGRFLGEEIFVQDGEGAGIIGVGVDAVQRLMEGDFTVGREGVLGALKIMRGGNSFQIGGETAVTTGIVPGDDVLAQGGQAGTVGVHGDRADPDGINTIGLGSGDSVNAEVVVREGHVATLHRGGQMHSISQAGSQHRVHLGRDVLNSLEGLELGGKSAQVTKGRVRETGGGEDVGEGNIELVRNILVVSKDPTGQVADLSGGTLVDGGEGVDVQLRIGLGLRFLRATRGGDGQQLTRRSIAFSGNEASKTGGDNRLEHFFTNVCLFLDRFILMFLSY